MYSRTPSLDSSLVLKDSGSSSTSPSRFPRMFVENQPSIPRRRALKPGARMVFIHRGDEFLRRGVHRVRLQENLSRAAPDDHRARDAVFLLEVLDVVAELQRQVIFRAAFFDVGARKLLDVILIERGFHRPDAAEHRL